MPKGENAEEWKDAFRREMDTINKHEMFGKALAIICETEVANKIVDG